MLINYVIFAIKGILKLNAVNAPRNYYVNQPLMNGEKCSKTKTT